MSKQFESWQQMAKPCVIIRKIHGPKETLSGHRDDHRDSLSDHQKEALGERGTWRERNSEREALGERHLERGNRREELRRETV